MISTTINTNLHIRYNLYGWRNFRCKGFLSRPLFAYIILCICTFVQNFSVNGANNAVISTIERVFYLNSVQSGLFLAVYDLATIISAPLVGYLGNFYSSPIFFSLNMIFVSFGNILIASSNFLNDDTGIRLNSNITQTLFSSENVLFQCPIDPLYRQNFTDLSCINEKQISRASQHAKALLYLGNCVNGFGSVALFTIGVAYIERIFPKEIAAYCQGIYFAVGTVGGALGIVVTGRFLLLYTKLNYRRRLPSWLTPSHPLWIGCWWLPYIIYGILCFIIGLFVSGLPNYQIPGEQNSMNTNTVVRKDSPTEETTTTTTTAVSTKDNVLSESSLDMTIQNRSSKGVINHSFSTDSLHHQLPINNSVPSTTVLPENSSVEPMKKIDNWKNMFSIICQLLKNTRYVFIVLVNLFEGFLLKGFVPFITKYFEYQHQIDTSLATLITGAIALLSVIIGCPLGAYFMNKHSWTPIQCARICTIILVISSFLFLFLIISCPELHFQTSSCLSENAPCCRNIYHPVCNINDPQKMFLSPCHFGCTNQTTVNDNSTIYYSSCDCKSNTVVSESTCRFRRIPCVAIFGLTLTGATFVVFFTAFVQVPLLHVLLYSVPFSFRNMALALRQTIVRVFGQTTGPLLFGFVFDQTCLFWLSDCYNRRTCKVYNNRRMGLSMALSGFFTRFLSGIACGVVYLDWNFRNLNHVHIPTTTEVTRF